MTFAVDLDGTIAEWGADRSRCGEWIVGAVDALTALRRAGHEIVVHSCRVTWEAGGGVREVARFLRSGGFQPCAVDHLLGDGAQVVRWRLIDEFGVISDIEALPSTGFAIPVSAIENAIGIWVGVGKPIAHAYIDDRAIPFTGDWATLVAQIEAM